MDTLKRFGLCGDPELLLLRPPLLLLPLLLLDATRRRRRRRRPCDRLRSALEALMGVI